MYLESISFRPSVEAFSWIWNPAIFPPDVEIVSFDSIQWKCKNQEIKKELQDSSVAVHSNFRNKQLIAIETKKKEKKMKGF